MRVFFLLIIWSTLQPGLPAAPIQNRIDSVNAITHDKVTSNLREFQTVFSENLTLARSENYEFGIAQSLGNLGLVFYLSGQYDKSTSCYLEAIQVFEKLGALEELARHLGQFGYQLKRRDLEKARQYMKQGIRLAETYNYESVLCGLLDNYGVLFEMSGRLDTARTCYQKALNLKRSLQDTLGIPYSLNNLAGIAAMQGDYAEAFNLLKQSADSSKNRSAAFSFTADCFCNFNLFVDYQESTNQNG